MQCLVNGKMVKLIMNNILLEPNLPLFHIQDEHSKLIKYLYVPQVIEI